MVDDTNKQDLGCMSDADPNSLHPDEALQRMREACQQIQEKETLSLDNALGRVLAEDLYADVDVPPQNNSAMDGYALRSQDLPNKGERSAFRLVGNALAGHPYSGTLGEYDCVRIMTGAPIPEGADTVIPQEQAEQADEQILLGAEKQGANVRYAGEDSKRGAKLCAIGKRLTAGDIGFIATAGKASCMVYRPLRVAFLSTGDELREIGSKLVPGCGHIYDSNSHSLQALLNAHGFIPVNCGLIEDTPEKISDALLAAANTADAVITSGGVSVGDADYIKQVLDDIGKMVFWKVAIKPGRPLSFGSINKAWFFGLPGNPVSVHVTWDQIVMPVLRHMSGENVPQAFAFRVRCVDALKKRPGRVEYQRGVLHHDSDGQTVVSKTGNQDSGIMGSMSQANCYIILDYDCSGVHAGETVTVQPFNTFL